MAGRCRVQRRLRAGRHLVALSVSIAVTTETLAGESGCRTGKNAGGTWLCRVPAGTSRDSPCGGRGAERAQPGRVVKVGSVILNAFIEPQYTFLSHGAGQPLFQLFSAINVQFRL
jgi:hypothetical protein